MRGPSQRRTSERAASLTLVQERRAEDRLDRPGEVAVAFASSACVLALAQQQVCSEPQAARNLRECLAAHERSPGASQLAFVVMGVTPVQLGGCHPAEERVAEILQPVVTRQSTVVLLVQERTMDDRLPEQAALAEAYAERSLQRGPV